MSEIFNNGLEYNTELRSELNEACGDCEVDGEFLFVPYDIGEEYGHGPTISLGDVRETLVNLFPDRGFSVRNNMGGEGGFFIKRTR